MALIVDGATPMLQELLMVSRGYATDALHYSSIKLQQAMQSKARSYGSSKFGSDFSTGKRRLRGSQQKGIKGRHFSRFSHSNGSKEHGLDEFIKFQASSTSLKSMVGFINFKGYDAEIYRNGKKTGSKYVKGQNVKSIGESMEYGGKQDLTEKQKKFFKASGWGKAAKRGYIQRKARPVVNPVFASMRGQVHGIIQEKYAKALSLHAAKMNKVRKVG